MRWLVVVLLLVVLPIVFSHSLPTPTLLYHTSGSTSTTSAKIDCSYASGNYCSGQGNTLIDWIMEFDDDQNFGSPQTTGGTMRYPQDADCGVGSSSGLNPNTKYYARAQAYCDDDLHSSPWTAFKSTYTRAKVPNVASVLASAQKSLKVELDANGNPDGTEYRYRLGGFYSGWTTGKTYTFTGLTPNTKYSSDVQARNNLGYQTSWSQPKSAYTLIEVPIGAVKTYADISSVEIKEDGIFTNFGVGQSAMKFEETSGNHGGESSDWQTVFEYDNPALDPNTKYCYIVHARNADGIESDTSPEKCIYTTALSPIGLAISHDGLGLGAGADVLCDKNDGKCFADDFNDGLPSINESKLLGNTIYLTNPAFNWGSDYIPSLFLELNGAMRVIGLLSEGPLYLTETYYLDTYEWDNYVAQYNANTEENDLIPGFTLRYSDGDFIAVQPFKANRFPTLVKTVDYEDAPGDLEVLYVRSGWPEGRYRILANGSRYAICFGSLLYLEMTDTKSHYTTGSHAGLFYSIKKSDPELYHMSWDNFKISDNTSGFEPCTRKPFDFTLSNPAATTVTIPSDPNSIVIVSTSINTSPFKKGVSETIKFEASASPSSITVSLDKTSCLPTCIVKLSAEIGANVQAGQYAVTLIATRTNGMSKRATWNLNIQNPPSQPEPCPDCPIGSAEQDVVCQYPEIAVLFQRICPGAQPLVIQ